MKRIITATVVLFAGVLTASAQVAVYDAKNIQKNAEQLLKTITLVGQMATQIEHMEAQIENWELTRIDEIVLTMSEISGVFGEMDISFDAGTLDGHYPLEEAVYQDFGLQEIDRLKREWLERQRDVLVTARSVQARINLSMGVTQDRVAEFIEHSNMAPGVTAATQAGNETLAVVVGQVSALQTLEIAALQEELEEEAQQQAEDAYHREQRRRFWADWPTNPPQENAQLVIFPGFGAALRGGE